MPSILAQLLGEGDPMFGLAVSDLERASGNLGVDARLTADIVQARGHALKALGLSVQHTTGPELYAALLHLARRHDGFLAKRLGVDDPADTAAALEAVARVANNVRIARDVWVIKRSVLRKLLKAKPPKKVMKALRYRSVDSMLKREQPEVLLAVMRAVEDVDWQHAFVERYTSLTPQDFEQRPLQILHPTSDKWQKIARDFTTRHRHNVLHVKEAGIITILPLPVAKLPGVTLAVLPRVLHYGNELRMYSALFKLAQMRQGFGELVRDAIIDDPAEHVRVAGQAIHWRIVHRHFGRQDILPQLFEPHVAPEDLTWHTLTEPLIPLEPALGFWEPLEHAGAILQGDVVSMHLLDVAEAAVNDLPYEQRTFRHMRRTIWAELYSRYLASPVIHARVVAQLGEI